MRKLHPPSRIGPLAAQGETVPAMAHAYALAAELAKPVHTGNLSQSEAVAALLVAALAAERDGLGAAPHVFRLQRQLFAQRLGQLTIQRQLAESKERLRAWRQHNGR